MWIMWEDAMRIQLKVKMIFEEGGVYRINMKGGVSARAENRWLGTMKEENGTEGHGPDTD